MKIITIGDNVTDCYLDQGVYYPGGNCVNVAVNAKRNGAEEAAYIGVFGNDEKALHIMDSLDKEGVSYKLSRHMIGISGQPKVNLTKEGDRYFVGGPKNTVQHLVKIRIVDEDLDLVKSFDVVHTSCYSFLEEEIPLLAKHAKVSYDFSDVKDEKLIERVCPYLSFAFFSGAEFLDVELDEFLDKLKKYDIEVIGITRGAKPALFVSKGNRYYREPIETDVVDTMGAGDSFIGGFLVRYLDSGDMDEALLKAAESASKTCTFFGGYGYPKNMI